MGFFLQTGKVSFVFLAVYVVYKTYIDVHENAGAVALEDEIGGALEGLGVVLGVGAVDELEEKVVDTGPALEVLDAADPVVVAPAEFPPMMELAANSEATRAEIEEKGMVSDTSE